MRLDKTILFMIGGNFVAGAEITNFNLVRDLNQQGYKILVITSGWNDGDFIGRLTQENIPHQSIKLGYIYIIKPLWTLDTLFHYPKAIFQLRSILKKHQPSWIFHATYRSFLMGYPLFKKYRNIYREHDEPTISKSSRRLYSFLNKKVDQFICPSQTVKSNLAQIGVDLSKITVIPSPLDPEFLNIERKEIIGTENIRIGIIGQIIPRKGFDFLFAELAKVNHPFTLFIYGDDSSEYAETLKISLSDKLKNKVKWMGFVKDRIQIYENLDIVIFPSLSESFGRIIIEAAAFGIPTIGSDLSCFKEIIQHGKTGYIYTIEKKEELVLYLERLIVDQELRKEMGKNAKNYALSNFTSNQCTEKFKTLLNE